MESVGATVQLSAEALDANDNPISGAVLLWSSSDPEIATFSGDGLVTAAGGGTVEIRAEALAPDGSTPTGVYGTASVSVVLPFTVFVSPASAEINALGEVLTLFAWMEDSDGNSPPGVTFSWSSSDPEVATVAANPQTPDGHQALVTAVSEGDATIRVTANGNSATAAITVKQTVAELRWVQQPQEGTLNQWLDPAPSVEALDANGHRVESFEGEITVEAQWVAWGESPPQPAPTAPAPPLEGRPLLGADGEITVQAVLGLAVFDTIRIIPSQEYSDGYYQLRALTLLQSGFLYSLWSTMFFINYGP
jgi:hypothetical protein